MLPGARRRRDKLAHPQLVADAWPHVRSELGENLDGDPAEVVMKKEAEDGEQNHEWQGEPPQARRRPRPTLDGSVAAGQGRRPEAAHVRHEVLDGRQHSAAVAGAAAPEEFSSKYTSSALSNW